MLSPILRASAASRWVPCPEAAWLEQQYPELDGDAAKEGTTAHEMAQCVLEGFVNDPVELIDRQATNGMVFVAEMIEPVMMYVDHIQSQGVGYWCEESISIDTGIEYQTIDEQGRPVTHKAIVTGTCDGATFSFDQQTGILRIVDFKYGHGPVEAFENWQLIIYAIGIIMKYNLSVKQVVLTVVQPRGWHHAGPVRSWSINAEQIDYYTTALFNAVRAVIAVDRKCQTGQHCRYCKVLKAWDCTPAKIMGMNAIDVVEATIPNVDTPDQIASTLMMLERASDAIKHTLSAIESRAEAMILNGQPIPGRSMQPGSGKSKWKDEQQAIVMGAALGIKLVDEKACTPAEAKRRGISKEVVKAMSTTPSTAPRLTKTNANKANEVFGT